MTQLSLAQVYAKSDRVWLVKGGKFYGSYERRGKKNASINQEPVALPEQGSVLDTEFRQVLEHRDELVRMKQAFCEEGIVSRIHDHITNRMYLSEVRGARNLWSMQEQNGFFQKPVRSVLEEQLSQPLSSYDGLLCSRGTFYGLERNVSGPLLFEGEKYLLKPVGKEGLLLRGYEQKLRKQYANLSQKPKDSTVSVEQQGNGLLVHVDLQPYVMHSQAHGLRSVNQLSFAYQLLQENNDYRLASRPRIVSNNKKNPFVHNSGGICFNNAVEWEIRGVDADKLISSQAIDSLAFPAYETARVLREGYSMKTPSVSSPGSLPKITQATICRRGLFVYENE